MKTSEIMTKREYVSVQGPIIAVPVSDVYLFCQRILDRLEDGSIQLEAEIRETMLRLKSN